MTDIELVIKIPEEIYQHYKKVWQKRRGSIPESCIAFGIPLPKGHGRLIDEERVSLSGIHFETERDHAMMIGRLNSAPTIIEADKTGSEV